MCFRPLHRFATGDGRLATKGGRRRPSMAPSRHSSAANVCREAPAAARRLDLPWRPVRAYRRRMNGAAAPPEPFAAAPMLGWRRLLVAACACVLVGLVISVEFPTTSSADVIAREIPVGFA